MARKTPGKFHLVAHMTGIWRLTDAKYRVLVAAMRAGAAYDLDQLGRFVGVMSHPATDAHLTEG